MQTTPTSTPTTTATTRTHPTGPMQPPPGTGPTGIDLMTPAQACHRLGLDEVDLLDLVNRGRLPAFDLGGNIRFRMLDIVSTLRAGRGVRSAA